MKLSPIKEVLVDTSNSLGIDPEIVASVISNYFKQIDSFIRNPTHVGIRIDYLGSIQGWPAGIRSFLLSELRSPTRSKYFSTFWKYRIPTQEYRKSRKFKKYGKSRYAKKAEDIS